MQKSSRLFKLFTLAAATSMLLAACGGAPAAAPAAPAAPAAEAPKATEAPKAEAAKPTEAPNTVRSLMPNASAIAVRHIVP